MSLELLFKKRLQQIAKERHLTPAVVWQNVMSDRFLVRLCQSRYKSNFILKGGTLLAKHFDIGRETRDLDFSINQLEPNLESLQKALQEIISIDMNDGFEFKKVHIESLNHFQANYPGAQVRIDASYGETLFSLFIDLGFGDHIEIQEQPILLLANSKGPLFETEINLATFPLEFVFAEKLETLVYRGAENSRMKDFHDLFTLLIHENSLNIANVQRAIKTIFEHRHTPLQLPLQFDENSLKILQTSWKRYLQSVTAITQLPENIETIIQLINKHLTDYESRNYQTDR